MALPSVQCLYLREAYMAFRYVREQASMRYPEDRLQ
jgi:hypothetical protein